MLSAILAKLAQDAMAAVARDLRSEVVRLKLREVQDTGHIGAQNPPALTELADNDLLDSLFAARTAGSGYHAMQ